MDLEKYTIEELKKKEDIDKLLIKKKSHIYYHEYDEDLNNLSKRVVEYILSKIKYIDDESFKVKYSKFSFSISFDAWSVKKIKFLHCEQGWYLSKLHCNSTNGLTKCKIHESDKIVFLSDSRVSSIEDLELPIKYFSLQNLEEEIFKFLSEYN